MEGESSIRESISWGSIWKSGGPPKAVRHWPMDSQRELGSEVRLLLVSYRAMGVVERGVKMLLRDFLIFRPLMRE